MLNQNKVRVDFTIESFNEQVVEQRGRTEGNIGGIFELFG